MSEGFVEGLLGGFSPLLLLGSEAHYISCRSGELIVVVEALLAALRAKGSSLEFSHLLCRGHVRSLGGRGLVGGSLAGAALLPDASPSLLEVEVA